MNILMDINAPDLSKIGFCDKSACVKWNKHDEVFIIYAIRH